MECEEVRGSKCGRQSSSRQAGSSLALQLFIYDYNDDKQEIVC
jgi:hypothetical protein